MANNTIFVPALFWKIILCLNAILLSRLLFITEGKYWNQLKKFRKFRVVLSSGSHESGSTAKKVIASDSAKPGPHIHIFFLNSGVKKYVWDAFLLAFISPYISKVQSHFWLKFGMLTSIYGALMLLNFCEDWGLELNFLGFQIEENFWDAKF